MIVLVISLVIGLMSSSLIMLAFYQRWQVQEQLQGNRLHRNADSGVRLMLSNEDIVEQGDELLLDLFGEGSDSVSLLKSRWGLFEIGVVRSFQNALSRTKVFLMGREAGDKEKIALYLTDQHRPLSVAGKTEIIGEAYLPEASIRKAYVDGKPFEGEQMVQGTIHVSQEQLPALDEDILSQLEAVFSTDIDSMPEGMKVVTGLPPDSIRQSFLDEPLIIYLDASVPVENANLKGHILLVSNHPLTIGPGCTLEDILVFAPSVLIRGGFSGSLQVVARDSIRIEENCRLAYPSVLGIIKRDPVSVEETQPEITIEKGSTLTGIVFTRALEGDDVQETRVTVKKGAVVNGQLYSDGFLDLQGKVTGTVFCNRFILQTSSTLYENHLLDAVIEYWDLPEYFTGSSLINTGKKGGVVKWLR